MSIASSKVVNPRHNTLIQKEYEIHYWVSGIENKEAIVFLHPAFSDHNAFNFQLEEFSKYFKVITLDLLGHGLSIPKKSKDTIDKSTDHIQQILENEGCKSVHIVGVSLGSLIAQYYALIYPHKVDSITAVGGYNINEENREIEKAQRNSNLKLIFTALFSMKTFKRKIAGITAYTKKGQKLFYDSSLLFKFRSFPALRGVKNIIKNRPEVRTDSPLFIITGEHEIELAKRMAEIWFQKTANSEYHVIPDAGHCANMDNPDYFNKILIELIKKSNHLKIQDNCPINS